LVRRLLEYKRYKSVLEEMREMEESRSLRNYRGNVAKELQNIATKALVDVELESITLFKLLKAFERVMQRMEDSKKRPTIHRIMQFSYSIEKQQQHILTLVNSGKKAHFSAVFGGCENRIHAIVTFLGLLELINSLQVHLLGGEGVNNFWLEPYSLDEEE